MPNNPSSPKLLLKGHRNALVNDIKKALQQRLGPASINYPGLISGNHLDTDTEAALRAWQAQTGMVADGIAGPRTLAALGLSAPPQLSVMLDSAVLRELFPYTRRSSIDKHLPYVIAALEAFGLNDIQMVSTALGTIRAETEGFVPIAEQPSHFNTRSGQAAFSQYENDSDLGNTEPGDGARFRGRGYVQLTGRADYTHYGKLLGIALTERPEMACAPEVAACLLATYLAEHRTKLEQALAHDDLPGARKVINDGSHGVERFTDTYRKASRLPVNKPKPASTKRKTAAARKAAPAAVRNQLKLDVKCDPSDLRDRTYQPPPHSLQAQYPADQDIQGFIGAYTQAGLVLNQGREGACTGFGLACVINYLRWRRAKQPGQFESVSPRMLYQFARRFDEYEGESYEGSSCRGALKGWYLNGVCLESSWPYAAGSSSPPTPGWDLSATEHTLGVYYRIDKQAIVDLQAAIQEVGAIYVSAYTHEGWDRVATSSQAPASHADLPVIAYQGRPSRSGGHAFALVGFNRSGFVIQNSWGQGWGAGGFAVISYADWLVHAMDAWVTAMGVPDVISGRVVGAAQSAGAAAAATAQADWWDEQQAYRHSIVLGNDGHVQRYDPQDGISRALQHQACVLPDNWFRQNSQHKAKRLVIYAHGGLNSEADAIKRNRAIGRYFTGNGCYPLFLVWKSGLLESIGDIFEDWRQQRIPAGLAGGPLDWLSDKFSDPLLEKTVGRPLARPLWSEMKENAELAAENGRGGDLLGEALRHLSSSWGKNFELHLIGHSAGSIALGRLLGTLTQGGLEESIKSVHLYAPACTVSFANRHYATQPAIMQRLHLDILSDQREQDDNVAMVYRKSLLYFVSNALEADLRMPILGLENVFKPDYRGWDGSAGTAEALLNWRSAAADSQLEQRLTIHPEDKILVRAANGEQREKRIPASHGGFDNNIKVISRTLERITGQPLALPVSDLAGF